MRSVSTQKIKFVAKLVTIPTVFVAAWFLAAAKLPWSSWFGLAWSVSSHTSLCIIPGKHVQSYPFYGEYVLALAKRCVAQIPIIGVAFLLARQNVFGSLGCSRGQLVSFYSLFLVCTVGWFTDHMILMRYIWRICLTHYQDPLRALALWLMLLSAIVLQCFLVALVLRAGRARAQLIHE